MAFLQRNKHATASWKVESQTAQFLLSDGQIHTTAAHIHYPDSLPLNQNKGKKANVAFKHQKSEDKNVKNEKRSNCIRRNITIQPAAICTKQALFQMKIAWKMRAPKEMHGFAHMLVQLLTSFWNIEALKNLAFHVAHASSKNSEVCTPYFYPQPITLPIQGHTTTSQENLNLVSAQLQSYKKVRAQICTEVA